VRIVKYASGVALREWKDKRSDLFISTKFEDIKVDTTVKKRSTAKKPKGIQ
jgi:hypothetical protein